MSNPRADSPTAQLVDEYAHLLSLAAHEFRTLGLQLGYWYEDSPICVADGTPPPPDDPQNYHACARPGSRAPHVPLADGRSTVGAVSGQAIDLRFGLARRRRGRRGSPYGSLYIA